MLYLSVPDLDRRRFEDDSGGDSGSEPMRT